MKLAAVAIALVLLVSIAYAQRKKPQPCAKAESQGELNICWGNQYNVADVELNKVYRQLVDILNADEKVQLKDAQNAWLKYRDLHCEFVADEYKGGSMRPMIHAMCLADVTKTRSNELRNQINDRNQ